MNKWINAARPRTLPLAASGIILGGIPDDGQQWNLTGFLWALITGILLQVLSNFANDYGDFKNGADQFRTAGPSRAVQSGAISQSQMKWAILLLSVLTLIVGTFLIYNQLVLVNRMNDFWMMMGIGILAIIAAYTYTAGPRPYGYMGLGDISVFIFFGLVGVLGTHFVLYDELSTRNIYASLFVGAMSVAVLHLNNMRDMDDDAKALKHTLALRLGWIGSKRYLFALFITAFISIGLWILEGNNFMHWVAMIPMIVLATRWNDIAMENHPEKFDPYLKRFALTCFFTVFLVFLTSFL
jgi:1,4-dihydroxy-2-naphthoate octaprenyltransferase